MNNALEELKNIYKPYRFTKMKNVTIIDSTSGSYVVKEKSNNKVRDAYNYLLSRNFDYFPKLALENEREEVNVFEYIPEVKIPKEQKALDMVDVVANLHLKTTYYKTVSEDKYKEIYENVLNNINYLTNFYNKLFTKIDEEIYMSPSSFLLIVNSSKLMASLDFCKKELDEWYEMVKKDNKERVSLIHNNLNTDHFLRKDKGYLISWENSKIDTPVLDLVNFYKNDYFNIDFETVLKKYAGKNPLSEEEKKLFFILISLVPEVDLQSDEFNNCKNIRQMLDYLYITEQLIRPYYTVEEEKK